MIELAIDERCSNCSVFEVEDVRSGTGDHILMCAHRRECYAKRVAAMEALERRFWVRDHDTYLGGGLEGAWKDSER